MFRLRFFTSGFSSARRRRLALPSSCSSHLDLQGVLCSLLLLRALGLSASRLAGDVACAVLACWDRRKTVKTMLLCCSLCATLTDDAALGKPCRGGLPWAAHLGHNCLTIHHHS